MKPRFEGGPTKKIIPENVTRTQDALKRFKRASFGLVTRWNAQDSNASPEELELAQEFSKIINGLEAYVRDSNRIPATWGEIGISSNENTTVPIPERDENGKTIFRDTAVPTPEDFLIQIKILPSEKPVKKEVSETRDATKSKIMNNVLNKMPTGNVETTYFRDQQKVSDRNTTSERKLFSKYNKPQS